MFELHKIIIVSNEVAFPIVFILFYERSWWKGLFKVMKNDHSLVFLAVWILFPKFLGRLRSTLYNNCIK